MNASTSPAAQAPPALDDELAQLITTTPGLRGLMLTTIHGEVRGVTGAQASAIGQLASFIIGAHDLTTRLAEEGGCGELDYVLIHAAAGRVLIHRVGQEHLLLALTAAETALGVLVHDLSWGARRLSARYA